MLFLVTDHVKIEFLELTLLCSVERTFDMYDLKMRRSKMRWYLNFYAFADSLDGITVWLLMPIVKPQSKPLTEMKLVEDVAKELESIVKLNDNKRRTTSKVQILFTNFILWLTWFIR